MKIETYLDCETMPDQRPGALEAFLQDAIDNFSAPPKYTKAQACIDLKLSAAETKIISKDDAIEQWVERFREYEAPEVAEYNWRRTALDGAEGELFSIAWATGNNAIKAVSRGICSDGDLSGEAILLAAFFKELEQDLRSNNHARLSDEPYFIGHCIAKFDLKFIFRRAVILGIKPPFELPFAGRHGQHFYDNEQGWAAFNGRISQDKLCKTLGIEGKPDDIDGSKVWDHIEDGNLDRVVEYNIDDVDKARKIYKRLNFIS